MNIEEKKAKLRELVEQFHKNIKQYKSDAYDEANTRVDFIDKFFELLDWDVRNTQGYSEQYREVVREDKVKIEGREKAPDYSFRIGGVRKFFVEAKKPSVYIKKEMEPSYQIRRYGYTAKLPLSILTDFEEFAVYDTRIKPDKNDDASVARIFYCTYLEYEKNWDFIYNTFSKSAILKGSFDRYIEENKNKKGTSEVDKELLKLIEEWRTELAKNIALRNPDLDIYNLNIAVQKIIDKIIFLRIAEDKNIEEYQTLLNATKSQGVYSNLNKIFIDANKKYNGGLFKKDEWLLKLKIDDKVLTSIINGLYYPECPYEFSILPVEILGNIYEQFLGKTIKFRNVKEGHTAIIEEKPEVRKSGGVYYTPQYIVNYIVENTVGEKIKNKTPEEISTLKICDPACGSGSFLVGAYQYLLNYHLEYYTNEKNIKKALKDEKVYQVSENSYKLTINEKQRILINNIYGVDIDQQAVEVTKLSLYLKLLENEGLEFQGYLFKHSDLKLLPDLDNNIKCGNSLIGSDFYKNKDLSLFTNEDMRTINAFDWDKEFPYIFKNGGFDVVIGNPPYGANLSDNERIYLNNKFNLNNTNTACLFIGLALKILKDNGVNGYIIPKSFIYASNWENIREKTFNNLVEIIDCNMVWKEVLLEQVIIILDKSKQLDYYISGIRYNENIKKLCKIDKRMVIKFGFYLNGISEKELKIGLKILNVGSFLNDYCINQRGAPYQKFIIENLSDYKVLGGKQIKRYFLNGNIKGYISKKDIKEQKAFINKNSILVQNIITYMAEPKPHVKIIATIPDFIITKEYVILDTINQLTVKDNINRKIILAILNSKFISWYICRFIFGMAIITMHFDNSVTSRIPIPSNCDNPKLIFLVDQMLDAQKLYHNAKTESDKKLYKHKIDLIDKQIDTLVYELYGLTENEIKIIEESL